MTCPFCKSDDTHSHGKRYSVYPTGIVAIVGLPFAMLHQASAPYDYDCNQCGKHFLHRTTPARIARILLVFIVAALIAMFVILIIGFLAGMIR